MKETNKKFIFIIDDSLDNRELLTMLLEAKGFDVQCACNGEEALSLLKELSRLPNLILLDALMPVMDGYEFRERQNNSFRLKDIPVVVMTGDDDVEMSKNMNRPQGIILKPLHINSVIESVSAFL